MGGFAASHIVGTPLANVARYSGNEMGGLIMASVIGRHRETDEGKMAYLEAAASEQYEGEIDDYVATTILRTG